MANGCRHPIFDDGVQGQRPLHSTTSAWTPARAGCTSPRYPHTLVGIWDPTFTELNDIRREARVAHAQRQYLIAEEHYRTFKEGATAEDVINLGALLRTQGRTKEGSYFYKKWINYFGTDKRLLLNACNCWNDNNEAHLVAQCLNLCFKGRH